MLTIWYGATSLVFGILLFFPVRKLMLALNINRQQFRLNRELNDEELTALTRKVAIYAAVVAVTFSFFYNKFIMLKFF